MASRESAGSGRGTRGGMGIWFAAAVVLLGMAGYVTDEVRRAGASMEVTARGDFWSAHNKHGTLLSIDAPADSLPLRPGDILRLAGSEGAGTRYDRVALRVARWGGQSSLVDLRFRERGAVSTRLTIVPGRRVVVDLVHRGADGNDTPLASATRDDLITDPDATFDIVLHFIDGDLSVSINGVGVLTAALEDPAAGRLSLWADGLRVHQLSVDGERKGQGGNVAPFADSEDFALLAGDSKGRAWADPLAAAVLGLALVAGWLASLPHNRPTPGGALATGVVACAPLAALHAVSLGWPLPPGVMTIGSITLAAVGLVLALPRLPRGPALPPGRWNTYRALATAALLGTWAALGVGDATVQTLRQPLRAAREALASVSDAGTWTQPAPRTARTLRPDNALVAPGPYRSLEARARVTLAPGSVFELRLRGHKTVPAGVALLLSAHDQLATGFVLQGDVDFRPLGIATGTVQADREHELVVTASGTHFEARLDGELVGQCDELTQASGGVYALAAAGSVSIAGLTVTPTTPEPDVPDAEGLALRSMATLLSGLLLSALLLAACLGRSPIPLFESVAFAFVPFALNAPEAETLGRLSYGNGLTIWGASAAMLVTSVAIGGAGAGAGRGRRVVAAGLSLALPALVLLATLGAPERVDRASKVSYQDFAGPRLAPGMVHFQHPLVRRYNTWLRDHRFRNRSVPLAKTPGTTRILCIGSSSTWGHGIPEGKADDYPSVLGRLLAERERDHSAEVINGAVRGTTTARMLTFFEEVLLRWEPDIVTVSFYFNDSVHLTTFDEQPWFAAIIEPGFELTPKQQWRTWRAVDVGRGRLSRLFGAFPAARGDSLAAWRAITGDAATNERTPPERFADNLRAYAALCAERDIDLVLIKEPVAGNIDRIWKREFYAAIDAVARETGAVVVDPTPALMAQGGKELFMDQIHPLPSGHAVMAETLLPVIRQLLWKR